MPEYLLNKEEKGDIIISDKLLEVYKIGKTIAQNYGGLIDSFQILNEPEVNLDMSANETGDKFAAFTKAMAIGYHEGNPDAIITTAGFAPTNPEVMDLCVRNKLLRSVLRNNTTWE